MDIQQIFENNKNWVASKLQSNPNYFAKLSEGQSPKILYIGCSDSRVSAEELMGVEPGQVFIHRNIANMVPNTDLNAMSVINYAVAQLEVDHVVVCGHYGCGGIKAAMQSADLGILNPWLRNIRDVYRIHMDELRAIQDENLKNQRLVELNVQEQCVNILKTPEVQRAVKERGLTVHGWVFVIHNGELVDLKINFEEILEHIMEIYRIV